MIRHIMETFSVLLTLCEGIHWWTAVPPNNGPVMQSFDVFISWHGTGWCSCGVTVIEIFIQVNSLPGVQQTTHKQFWSWINASHRITRELANVDENSRSPLVYQSMRKEVVDVACYNVLFDNSSWTGAAASHSNTRHYGGVEGPPHIFFRHHAISYGWHNNSSVGDSNYCYVIRRTY